MTDVCDEGRANSVATVDLVQHNDQADVLQASQAKALPQSKSVLCSFHAFLRKIPAALLPCFIAKHTFNFVIIFTGSIDHSMYLTIDWL